MITRTRHVAAWLLAAALIVAVAAPGAAAHPPKKDKSSFRLTLLHNNDGESKLATGDSRAGYGGVARFATVLQRLRDEADAYKPPKPRPWKPRTKKGTLFVSSGDNILAGIALLAGFESGPPWPDAKAISALGYDALTIGNHEFDFGQSRLAEFIQGVDPASPFITANLGFENTVPELRELAEEGRIVPSVVVKRGGEKFGVIGLTTPDIRSVSSPGNVTIRDDLAAVVNGEVRDLRRQGVNKIVVSAHLQGIAADEALIPQVRGVDIWIAGGGDDLLSNPDDTLIPGDAGVGPYPKAVEDSRGRSVLVVSTAGEYKYVGRLTVQFGPGGRVRSVDDPRSGPVRVTAIETDPDFAPEDPFLKAEVVDPVAVFREQLASQPVGSTEVSLSRTVSGLSGTNDPIRRRESGYGNLVTDSFLWTAQQQAALDPELDEPQVAFTNGGGVRADIPAGAIDKALTFGALPFFSQVVVVEDVGCEPLRQLLERGYAGLPAIAGQFANVAGLRVDVDPSQPAQTVSATAPPAIVTPGQRVRNLWLSNGTPQNTADDTQLIQNGNAVPGCAPVDVATLDFLTNGGDNYPFAFLGLTAVSTGTLYNQALEDYIAAPIAEGGLGGVVTAAQYPVTPGPADVRRITIAGD